MQEQFGSQFSTKVFDKLRRIWSAIGGQDLIEYALMAGFVAVAAGAIMPAVATSISTIFSKISSVLSDAANQGSLHLRERGGSSRLPDSKDSDAWTSANRWTRARLPQAQRIRSRRRIRPTPFASILARKNLLVDGKRVPPE